MNDALLRQLAESFLAGKLTGPSFLAQTHASDVANLGEAQIDLDRRRRCGFPEVVYAEGKTVAQMEKIFHVLLMTGSAVLATRMSPEQAEPLLKTFPGGRYNAVGRVFRIDAPEMIRGVEANVEKTSKGRVAVVTAGTSDLPVAEEARETLLWAGAEAIMVHDVGVAGPHRLPANLSAFEDVDAVVVVAGMEGALPSVVGGYVDCPVIAVPTSVGYGASFGGVAALLSMLNSCASNVTVVNIDAGFKAGYVAGLIAKNARRNKQS